MKLPNKLQFTDYQLKMIQGLSKREESIYEYINKDVIIDEMRRRIELLENGTANSEVLKRIEGTIEGYKSILSFIENL